MRNIRQMEARDAWLNNPNTILNVCPRVGKCKIGIEILKKLGKSKVLVCYPNTVIQESWKNDIQKWNYTGNIEYSTFLSLSRVLSSQWDIIILDEIHSLSEAQIAFLKDFRANNPKTLFLGLTGTLSKDTESILKEELNLVVSFKYSIEQAIKEGVVSDYLVEIHTVPLDNQVLKDYSTKKKKVKRTEKQQFDHLSSTISWMESSGKATFFMRLARMRLIQGSIAKLKKTQQLLNGRCLVFCGTTALADQIGCPVYHNKSKEEQLFQDFCNGKVHQMAVCKMLSMGVTIQKLDSVTLNYTDSNEENLVQKIMRCMNFDYAGKTAKIIIICSTEPVEIQWIKKALKPLDKTRIIWK